MKKTIAICFPILVIIIYFTMGSGPAISTVLGFIVGFLARRLRNKYIR